MLNEVMETVRGVLAREQYEVKIGDDTYVAIYRGHNPDGEFYDVKLRGRYLGSLWNNDSDRFWYGRPNGGSWQLLSGTHAVKSKSGSPLARAVRALVRVYG